ncbi:hypothetical protein DPMN_070051 [Dreissena polymorpha]|uniref:Uncharacterized protein n=1 Tax=Dreissena polymorpha TaxID=45954 RepID=A0A9D3Z098_DREPO|nr:hypothetical protein DPMN_070051 [Dreissena polymorpha]
MVMSALTVVVLFIIIVDFRADLHPICSGSFIEYVGDILKFTAGATDEVNVTSESQVGDGSSTDGDRCVVVMYILLHYLFNDKVKQDGSDRTSLKDANRCHKEVPLMSIEKFCNAGVSVEFLHNLQQRFVNVGSPHNIVIIGHNATRGQKFSYSRPALNPACSLTSNSSVLLFNRWRMMSSMICNCSFSAGYDK